MTLRRKLSRYHNSDTGHAMTSYLVLVALTFVLGMPGFIHLKNVTMKRLAYEFGQVGYIEIDSPAERTSNLQTDLIQR